MKQRLLHMLEELQQYKCTNRDTLIQMYVTERLDKSFAQYDKELQQSIEFLTRKHEKSLLKRLNKLNDNRSN